MKWLHNLLKGLSLTAALFVFQACYGTPPGYPEDCFEEEVVEAPADEMEAVVDEVPAPEVSVVTE